MDFELWGESGHGAAVCFPKYSKQRSLFLQDLEHPALLHSFSADTAEEAFHIMDEWNKAFYAKPPTV